MEKKATRVAYGEYMAKLGETNDKLVVLDADLAGATMTQYFKKAHPDRFFDCGIAEANMVDLAAGMSTTGLIPFCSTSPCSQAAAWIRSATLFATPR